MTVKNPWASRIVGHAEVAPSGRPLGARRENGAPRKIRTSDLQIRSLSWSCFKRFARLQDVAFVRAS